MLLLSLISTLAIVRSATNAEFNKLKQLLICEIENSSDDVVEHWSRMSFHDLHLQTTAGMHGCLINPDFLADPGNAGLSKPTKALFNLINENFPPGTISFGDAIAFSGKVGYEYVFPWMNIPFKFGRSACKTPFRVQGNSSLPMATIFTRAELEPNLQFLKLSAAEMAILVAGGHGLKHARADDGPVFRGSFAHVDSGTDYILKTLTLPWLPDLRSGFIQYFNGKSKSGHIRLPIDMLFYPSRIPRGFPRDNSFRGIEAFMARFTQLPRGTFDVTFAKVYGKMLAIGGGHTDYVNQPLMQDFKCPGSKGKKSKGKKSKGEKSKGKKSKGKKGKKGKK